jgi:hypothetical protein
MFGSPPTRVYRLIPGASGAGQWLGTLRMTFDSGAVLEGGDVLP